MSYKIELDQVKAYYAVINRGDGDRCAWCDKLISDFKYPDEHITIEDTLAKIDEAFDGEELLYGDFRRLREKILEGGENK